MKNTLLLLLFSFFLITGTAVTCNADVSLPEDLEKEYATKEEKKLAEDFLRLLDSNARFSSGSWSKKINGIKEPQCLFSSDGVSIYGYSEKEKQPGVLVSDFGKEAIWHTLPPSQKYKGESLDASHYFARINSTFYFNKSRATEEWYRERNIFEGKIVDGKIKLQQINGKDVFELLRQQQENVTWFFPPGTEFGSKKHSSAIELTLKSGETIRLLSGVFFKGNGREPIVRLYVLDENDKLLYSLPLALPPIQNTYFFQTEDGVIGRNIQIYSEAKSKSVSERYFSLKKLKLDEKKILHARSLSSTEKGNHLLVLTRGTEGDVFYVD